MVPENGQYSPRQVALVVTVAYVVALCAYVLSPFIAPIVWATILAYLSWPAYSRLRSRLGKRRTLSASLMTLAATAALLIPLLWLAATLRDEGIRALNLVRGYLSAGPLRLPELVRQLPGGDSLDAWLQAHTADSNAVREEIILWARMRSRELIAIVGGIGRDVLQMAFCLVTLFFLYRDADNLVGQVRSVFFRLLGPAVDRDLKTVGDMVHAVMYGVLLTAFLQGLISGIGYRLVGVQPCVLLGTLTAFASFVPVVGTLSVIGPVTVVLVMGGQHWAGLLLLVWGIVLVHPIDNLVRPLVVSSVTHMPMLLAMFGVLGGLLAFGLAGIFVGPLALAVGLALWKELAAPGETAAGRDVAGAPPPAPGPTR